MQLLRLLHRICPARQPELTTLIRQCDEITAILVASLKTAKRRAQVQDVLRPRDRRH
jgi:hypothetical protein